MDFYLYSFSDSCVDFYLYSLSASCVDLSVFVFLSDSCVDFYLYSLSESCVDLSAFVFFFRKLCGFVCICIPCQVVVDFFIFVLFDTHIVDLSLFVLSSAQ